jgi:molybdate transport system substrate-binding protein
MNVMERLHLSNRMEESMNKHRALLSLIIGLVLIGCSTPGADRLTGTEPRRVLLAATQPASLTTVVANHTLVVFAAASLTGAFQEMGKDFENANSGVNVRFNFAGSQILRTQLEQGASADIFASADHKNMDQLVTDNLINASAYLDFATNKLIVILPSTNPGNVKTLADMSRTGLKLILADSSVPAGNYARQILTKMNADPIYGSDYSEKVLANVVSNETDVKQVVTKVDLGEADAGIVYISDAIAAPDLVTITIPDMFNVTALYPIAILTNAPEPQLADAFIAYVMSPAGQAVMMKWGFSQVTH